MEVDKLEKEDGYYAVLKFKKEGIQLEKIDESGEKSMKFVAPDDLRNIFVDNTVFDFGFLPLIGKDYIGLRRYIKEGSKEIFFIESTPRKVNTSFRDIIIENVAWPSLLMVIIADRTLEGKLLIKTTKLFALKTPCLSEKTKMYRFPFANVYTGDNRICWGDLEEDLDEIKNAGQMSGLVHSFIYSIMNDDLYSSGSGDNPDHNHEGNQASLKSFLRDCAKDSIFPYDILKDLDMSFDSLIDVCKRYN